jgi:hypothetical protein
MASRCMYSSSLLAPRLQSRQDGTQGLFGMPLAKSPCGGRWSRVVAGFVAVGTFAQVFRFLLTLAHYGPSPEGHSN